MYEIITEHAVAPQDPWSKKYPCSVVVNETSDVHWEQMVDWCNQHVGIYDSDWTTDEFIRGESPSNKVVVRYWWFPNQDIATQFQLVWG